MAFGRQRWVESKRGGGFALNLEPELREMLADLLVQLREVVLSGDQVGKRLFPPAYAQDQEKEEGYRALVGNELIEQRLATIESVEASLDADEVDADTLDQLMRSVNDLRLVIGTRLDVSEDDDGELDPDDPDFPLRFAYAVLTQLLHDILRALS